LALSLSSFMAGSPETNIDVHCISSGHELPELTRIFPDNGLKVMTLNLAHGRSAGRHQILQSSSSITRNLDSVARLLERESPDVVAFQEADIASAWNGSFNHAEYLAHRAEYDFSVSGEHVRGLDLSYGTAMISRVGINEARSVTFNPRPPLPSKGFVISTITWPGSEAVEVDIVSVHLDFASAKTRRRQVERMVGELAHSDRPLIIMGDFNCEWGSRGSVLRQLADNLDLQVFEPESPRYTSFPGWNKRLDWILISPEFRFENYNVLPDVVSDHLGVTARILPVPGRFPGLLALKAS
jgi:endonuclease/exonuclease/phosphatase family metal-dependent hydrolase